MTSIVPSNLLLTGVAIVLTAVVYATMLRVHRRFCPFPWAHPLILTVASLMIGLALAGISVSDYQKGASLINWFLGPVTVALAVPIYQQWQNIKRLGTPLLFSVLLGGFLAPILAWLALWTFDAPLSVQLTMLVKSITTPLAMGAAEEIGGLPSLAAVIVIVTGIVGTSFADFVFRLFRVTDLRAQGIALGTVAHAVGTAKAISESTTTGAFASVALCINGVATAVLLPFLFWLFA